jgi:Cu/Zn superoxide dismutase
MKLVNFASVLTAVAVLSVPPITVEAAETAKAMLKDANGQEAGSVSFTQTPAGVLLQLSLKGVATGSMRSTSMQWASASRPSSSRQAGISTRPMRITG